MWFPFERVRPVQREFMRDVEKALENGENLVAHAPTGVGKTAAVLSVALPFAIENGYTLFFLTPKHTQHAIVLETVRKMMERHGVKIRASDFIGKQWLCLIPGARELSTKEFSDFCSNLKKEERCPFYNNLKEVRALLKEIGDKPLHSEEVKEICAKREVCPYEVLLRLGRKSHLIIADYYHVFSKGVRCSFLGKMDKSLGRSILVVDEAHNLPDRLKSLMSSVLTDNIVSRGVREARKFGYLDHANILSDLLSFLRNLEEGEYPIRKEEFVEGVEEATEKDYFDLYEELTVIGNEIRLEQKRSYVGSIASFLESWEEEGEGFFRFVKKEKRVEIRKECLDPSLASREVFEEAYSSILMSGTLSPTSMYAEVLGLKAKCVEYPNPFPKENRMVLIFPETTTRYVERSGESYKSIADVLERIREACPGNMAVFFPSYEVLEGVSKFVRGEKFVERKEMKKKEKMELFRSFTSSERGLLLAVAGGSFSEGMDYPGKFLECAVIVGIPLEKPDLLTKARISYYQQKLGQGWNYGYIFPAMNRAIQAAGRVIRSESDRGVIIFMDKRYLWRNYLKCIPSDWSFRVTKNPWKDVREFFKGLSS